MNQRAQSLFAANIFKAALLKKTNENVAFDDSPISDMFSNF